MRVFTATKAYLVTVLESTTPISTDGLGLSKETLVAEGPNTRWYPWRGNTVVNALRLLLAREGVKVTSDGVSLEISRMEPGRVRAMLQTHH